jgi:heme/copper-type cytochrome/quinol oxidase subunit 2
MKMKNKITLAFTLLFNLLVFVSQAQDNSSTPKEAMDKSQIILIVVLSVSIIILFVLIYFLYALNAFLNAARKSGDIKDAPAMLRLTDAVPRERTRDYVGS